MLILQNLPEHKNAYKSPFFSFCRFQLRAYLKSTGPFKDVEFQENDFSDPHITGITG